MKIIAILLLLLLLSGCANSTVLYRYNPYVRTGWEPIYKTITKGKGEQSLETPDGYKYSSNTKQDSLLKEAFNFQGLKVS